MGQGKWYPGEQLPRWALGCYWRRDGEPAWKDPTLFADEARGHGHGTAEAARFIRALAVRLGVPGTHVQTGYEDVWYYLWRERRLPINVDPFDARLDDEMERDRLRRVFAQGLDEVVGYALPLARDEDGGCWRTGAVAPPRRADVSHSRRFADGLSPAARLAALGEHCRLAVTLAPGTPRRSGRACPRTTPSWPARSRFFSFRGKRAAARSGRQPASSRRGASSARRCAWSPGAASSMCSCRRSPPWRIIWSWWRRSRPRPPRCRCRSCSRDTRHPPIRASRTS